MLIFFPPQYFNLLSQIELKCDLFRVLTSIQYYIRLDIAGFKCRKELGEQEVKGIIIPSILLVQTVAKVEPVVETAAINNQRTVPKLHILEEVSVPFHIGGQTPDPHQQ